MCPSPIYHLLKIRRPIDQARRSFLLSLLHRFSAPPSLANAIRFLQRRHPGSDTAGIKTMGRWNSRRDNKQLVGYHGQHHKLSEVALQLHLTHNKSTTKNLQGPPRTNTEQGTQTKIKNTKHDTAFHIISQTAKKRTPRNGTCTKRGAAASRRMASSIRSGPVGARGVFN